MRGSVSECEVVLQTFGQAFLYLLLHVDTLTLDDDDREQFYRKLMSMVSVATPFCMQEHIHVLMRDEKEERKEQARSNKQQG